jgi:hypothetical protein
MKRLDLNIQVIIGIQSSDLNLFDETNFMSLTNLYQTGNALIRKCKSTFDKNRPRTKSA